MWPQLNGRNFTLTFSCLENLKKWGRHSYNLILLPQTRSTTQRSILLCHFPSSLWEMTYPLTKCHSLRLVILCPVRQLASDTLQVRHVISSCLDPVLTVEEMLPPLTSGFDSWCQVLLSPSLSPAISCCFHPSLPIRAVFSVAIFGLSEKNHKENNWRQHSFADYI